MYYSPFYKYEFDNNKKSTENVRVWKSGNWKQDAHFVGDIECIAVVLRLQFSINLLLNDDKFIRGKIMLMERNHRCRRSGAMVKNNKDL